MKKFLVALSLAAFAFVGCDDSSSASAGPNEEIAEGILTDSRDGQTYKTITIGTQTCSAENEFCSWPNASSMRRCMG